MLRCNNNTGLCTTLVKRPDNTICPGGRCQSGECKTKHPLFTSCPAHTNTCKVLLYDPVNGTCTNEVKKLERTTCPGGTCKTGVCRAAAQCPTECPTHEDVCKAWECNLATGACTVEVIKPDKTSCNASGVNGTCRNGSCISNARDLCANMICQPHKELCKAWVCDADTGSCTIEANKPDKSPCTGWELGGGCCLGGACLAVDPPVSGPCMTYVWNKTICAFTPKPEPVGKTCDGGVCNSAGACIPFRDPCANTTCPPHKDVCKAWKCDANTSNCTIVVNKPDKSPCNQEGDGTCCIAGECLAAMPPAPGPCMTHVWNQSICGFTPKPENDGKICNASGIINGTCNNGSCISNLRPGPCTNTICPPHKELCKAWVCNADTGSCTIEVNKPDKSPCTGMELGGGCCFAGACLAIDPPVSGPCMTNAWDPATCSWRQVNKPDKSPCPGFESGGCCVAGGCLAVDPPVSGPCMTNAWDPATCTWALAKPKPDGTSCSGGICTAGVCGPTPKCPSPCPVWECNNSTNQCSREVTKPDKSPCTGFESGGCCFAGACLAIDPPVSGPCMTNAWDPATCTWAVAKPVPDGKLCSDGNTCTAGDACKAGTCTGNATAADGTQCTSGGCIGTCNNSKCGQPMMCP
uniref:Uncharacterized protein n=1 Tax=Tetradesmus obliquus TaxID=3088 RepID=A0A383V600_TETOB|eukprot:jgi/Sobl393_1/11761/SZX59786.1